MTTNKRWLLWKKFINKKKLKSIAEIGVWKGEFARYLLKECPSICRYTLVDSWRHLGDWNKPFNLSDSEFKQVYKIALRNIQFAKAKTKVLKGTTLEVRNKIKNNSFDLVYLDGDHSLRGIVLDVFSLWPKIKKGGFLAGDDFTSNVWQHSQKYEPSLVNPFVRYFAEALGEELLVLGEGQFAIQKTDKKQINKKIPQNLGGGLLPLLQKNPALYEKPVLQIRKKVKYTPLRLATGILRRLSPRFREWETTQKNSAPFPQAIMETGVLFIHIPKAAGTSISLELYGFPVGHRPLSDWCRNYPMSVSKLKVFTVIREPIDRFISAFHFLKSGGMNKSDLEFAKTHLKDFDTPEALALSFQDPKIFSAITAFTHFVPQVSFFEIKGEIPKTIKIFDFSDLQSLENWLIEQTGRAIKLPTLNKTGGLKSKVLQDKAAQKILEAVYRKDFDIQAQVKNGW